MTVVSLHSQSVLETILEWSSSRPAWQRDALRRIVTQGQLDDNDVLELVELCKNGNGKKDIPLTPVPLSREHLPANPAIANSVSLLSISAVSGVNNLAPEQSLTFAADGLTIIYGDNGTGKSGYTRILKRACRARHTGKIEPNIYADTPLTKARATIEFVVGETAPCSDDWQDSEHPHVILSAVSVFDSKCASVHINEKNEVAFRPFGLDIPDELAGVCQTVKEVLNSEQKQLEKAVSLVFGQLTWNYNTEVGKILSTLKYDTNIETIKELSELNSEQKIRLSRLKEDLAKDPTKAASEQKLIADTFKDLHFNLMTVAQQTSDVTLQHFIDSRRAADSARQAARLAAEKAFSQESLAGIGSAVWQSLWEAARRYSTEIAYVGEAFPSNNHDTLCVLCHQPLQDDAIQRMYRFDKFIQEETERQSQVAQEALDQASQQLTSTEITFFRLKVALQHVRLLDVTLCESIQRFLAQARLRRYILLKRVDLISVETLPEFTIVPIVRLAKLESSVRKYADELHATATDEERIRLKAEFNELNDRHTLCSNFSVVKNEIERLVALKFLEKCIADTNTTAITKLGNDIADQVITPRLRDKFHKEIVKLSADKVRVEIIRSGGRYGSPQYQIRLLSKPNSTVQNILSEGEQTCVALAAFLTEVATATHRSTFVFDDPVSSLDHRWRKKVASRLVEEAEHRQIIVFTHDLVFVNDLYDLACEEKRNIKLCTTSRGATGAGIVSPGLPWKAQKVEDRIDKLEKASREARILYDNDQEDEYMNEAVKIYDRLRASWERALEDVAFSRVVQRHRDYIDTKHLRKIALLTDADCETFHAGFKKCCEIVDAHDPSRARNASPPVPEEIFTDIGELKTWVCSLRDRQKLLDKR